MYSKLLPKFDPPPLVDSISGTVGTARAADGREGVSHTTASHEGAVNLPTTREPMGDVDRAAKDVRNMGDTVEEAEDLTAAAARTMQSVDTALGATAGAEQIIGLVAINDSSEFIGADNAEYSERSESMNAGVVQDNDTGVDHQGSDQGSAGDIAAGQSSS